MPLKSTPPVDLKKSIPRTCQTYTKAYRNVTRLKFKRYNVTLGLFCVVLAILTRLELSLNYSTYINVLSFKTVLFSFLLFAVGSIISVLRNLKFTVWEPTYSSNIAEFLSVCTCTDNLLVLIVHVSTSLVIICSYLSWIMDEKYTSSFLLKAPGHYLGARQLNQEKIFVYLYGVILGLNYTVGYLSNRTFVVKINNVQQPFHYEIKNSLAIVLFRSVLKALWSFAYTFGLFIFCNGSIYYFVARIFGSYYRVLDSSIVGFRWSNIHLFLRLFVAGTLIITTFNLANRIYDVAYSYTLPYTDPYDNQFECLLQGLSEKENDNIKAAAFSELALLSTKRPDKRKELFKIVVNELQESYWYKIMTQCLLVMEDLCTKIDIEYNGVRPAVALTPAAKPIKQNISNRLKFSNEPVCITAQKKQIYHDDRTSSVFSEASELAEDIPDRLPQPKMEPFSWLQKSIVVDMIKSLEFRFGSIGTLEPLYADTVLRRMQTVFYRYQLVIWAVQSLGSLTAVSLKEDSFGFVQNDIDGILNSLLRCLVDVERYVKDSPIAYKKLLDQKMVPGEVEAVILALKEAIYQVTTTFNKYTDNFKVDSKYDHKWQDFLNFQE